MKHSQRISIQRQKERSEVRRQHKENNNNSPTTLFSIIHNHTKKEERTSTTVCIMTVERYHNHYRCPTRNRFRRVVSFWIRSCMVVCVSWSRRSWWGNGNNTTTTRVTVVDGLKIGRRRILCTTRKPGGGGPARPPDDDDNDHDNAAAVVVTPVLSMDPKPTLPLFMGFAGCQSLVPVVGNCPNTVSYQPPWYGGDVINDGGGLCPLSYIQGTACLPGLVLLLGSVIWYYGYITSLSNRFVITDTNLGIGIHSDNDEDDTTTTTTNMILFSDIDKWYMTPIGLIVQHSSTRNNMYDPSTLSTSFFPLYWDSKSVETVLEDRIHN